MKLKNTLKTLKLNESMISMILGAVVIIVAGILIINYFSNKRSEAAPPLLVGDELTLPIVHIVGEGEDLWSISEKYYDSGYSWISIAKENGITNPDLIEEGQELTIPVIEEEKVEVTPTLGTAAQAEGKSTHTISKDEDLWKIAEKYYDSGYNWVDIAKTNNIKDANHIEVGDLIIIPAVEAKKSTVLGVKHTDAISGATYTVVQGDSLWGISVRAFGDGYKWVEIAEENGLQNPDIIHSGNILTLPR